MKPSCASLEDCDCETNRYARPQGFTLIELLVVIAVIVLMAAILFPVFSRARENARRASCASNVKQIGLGLMQYSQDYDEKYPTHRSTVTDTNHDTGQYQMVINYSDPAVYTTSKGQNWIANIEPYVKSWLVFKCPSTTPTSDSTLVPSGNNNSSYMANGVIVRVTGLHQSAITSTAAIIFAGENNYSYNMAFCRPYHDPNSLGYRQPLYTDVHNTLHFEGGNLLFCDGHVKWRKATGISMREYGLTNADGTPTNDIGPSTDQNILYRAQF